MTVGRFAPSPSGRMHLGNLFAALLAWCAVRAEQGEMLLRIEDLDPQRCRPAYAEQIKRDLERFGLDWDREAPAQSSRTPAYAAAFGRLKAQGLVYPCYCTRNQLHAASAPHASDGQYIYPGTCRGLTPAQRAGQTRAPAWRIRVPEGRWGFRDGLQGEYFERPAEDCGDFILRRSDGVYAYQLAVVTDDGENGVTQVVRGRDLLSSTPRQRWLFSLLGLPAPDYYHVPLLLAPDGRRLSKRDGDMELGALLARLRPEQIIGGLAHAAGLIDRNEPITAAELASVFDWKNLRRENICLTRSDPILR